MLTNPSQLIVRNIELLANHKVLLLNIEADTLGCELLDTATEVTALALDFNHFNQLVGHGRPGLKVEFGHELQAQDSFDSVVVFFPKAKSLAPYLFNLAAQYLKAGGQLLVCGENKGGIKSLDKLLPACFGQAHKLDNARHCLLYLSQLEEQAPVWNLDSWIQQYSLPTPAGELVICNAVGVFSDRRLDEGTALLLDHLPRLHGRVLDFGCGAGVIAAALLKQQPELTLECVDINAMALLSCQRTMAANGMQAKIYPSDGLAQTEGRYDAIISNPPFHDGLKSTTDIATRFVEHSATKLSDNGQWHIVANRHLPYADTIASVFGKVQVLAENNKYKVYHHRCGK
ncbi:methyltransferase [Shewanella sedimentimangrovi]|uniref:Ribosomal RNA small subunit methyltransferase C n=1 Tax=Shewanella sedimentimangrovi TaxID=2814293 RepID=A0ABX7R1Q5_9GAMM|nr:methyltransferase [Shewanella sedimentimangrovi]QSX37741.1 methyltransferase [Shewanella sedimentimangrovi]